MFIHTTSVCLADTDATGVLYFPQQFNMALRAFEAFLKHQGFSLRNLLDSPYLLPVVHAEADYKAPVEVGDTLEISVELERLGESSITMNYLFHDREKKSEVGSVRLVHVVVERVTRLSQPIPESLRMIFAEPS